LLGNADESIEDLRLLSRDTCANDVATQEKRGDDGV